jgi:hypothetical protein
MVQVRVNPPRRSKWIPCGKRGIRIHVVDDGALPEPGRRMRFPAKRGTTRRSPVRGGHGETWSAGPAPHACGSRARVQAGREVSDSWTSSRQQFGAVGAAVGIAIDVEQREPRHTSPARAARRVALRWKSPLPASGRRPPPCAGWSRARNVGLLRAGFRPMLDVGQIQQPFAASRQWFRHVRLMRSAGRFPSRPFRRERHGE